MKRQISIISAILLILLSVAGCAKGKEIPDTAADSTSKETFDLSSGFEGGTTDEFQKIAENDSLILSANLKNGQITVQDKASGKIWYSNPADMKDDAIATGFNKAALFSQVLLTYKTSEAVEMNVASFMGSVSRGGLTYRIDGNSLIFKYSFEKEQLVVPIRYSITDSDFSAEILTAGVQELGTNQITTIDLLPYFGSGSKEDNGYLMVPDGSGALIYFNNGKVTAREFEKNLYGFDNGVNDMLLNAGTALNTSFTLSENIYLPVFGEKCNEDGFIGIITDGAARASIKARTAGNYTSYNNVWSTYNYRTVGTVRLTQKDMSRDSAAIPEKSVDTSVNYKVLYRFLENKKAEYSDMAKAYRDYLISMEGLTARTESGAIPFYLDMYGYIRKTKSFLGIPKDTMIVTTSIADASGIVSKLSEAGIGNVVMKYNFWMTNGYYQTIQTGAKVERKLGSLKDMQALSKQLADNGGTLYLAADLMNVYKTGNGVSKYNDTLKSIANTPQMQYKFSLDSALTDPRYKPWYLITPSHLSKYFDKFFNNFNKTGIGNVAFDSIGSMAYSDLSSGGTSRTKIPGMYHNLLVGSLSKVDNIMLSSANDYAAVCATDILNTPGKCSNYDIEDVSIPFFQAVFHGYINYSIGATNLSSNPDDMTLKCLEYGAAPLYSWVSRNSEELIGSKTDYLFSPDYTKWMDYAITQYDTINSVLKDTQNLPITSHSILQTGVTQTVYGGSLRVLVNYNSTDVNVDGNTISAKDYLVLTGTK